MRLLITGGAGYIGSHATRLFLAEGHDVWVFDNLSRGHLAAVPDSRLIVGDLADRVSLESVLRKRKIEAVVHFAALTYVGESVQNPGRYYENNVAGTANLLEAIRNCSVNRLVFSSTAAVYGNPERVPIQESDSKQPINPYGRTKYFIEQMLADYASAYGIGYAALRYFNAAGASPEGDIGEDHEPETHLIPLVLQVALGQRPLIDVFGTDYPTPDGTCVRDYIHVNDLARAHLRALECIRPGEGRAFNLGTGRGYSVKEVVAACHEVTGRGIAVKEVPARAGDPAELIASPQLALQQLEWRPRYTDLRETIETAWKWHRQHPNGYGRNNQ
ncbi:MAG: galE 3 [Planctomycetaceae bacterium]|nr:galE 3 [Planctomycetaceae bacterium]